MTTTTTIYPGREARTDERRPTRFVGFVVPLAVLTAVTVAGIVSAPLPSSGGGAGYHPTSACPPVLAGRGLCIPSPLTLRSGR